MRQFPLGYLPDRVDPRDLSVDAVLGRARGDETPLEFGALAQGFDSLLVQSAQSCVGFSIATALLAAWRYRGASTARIPSPRFIWYNARVTHAAERLDSGTYIRAALHQLARLGYCDESACPSLDGQDLFLAAERPTRLAYHQAHDQRLEAFQYGRVDPGSQFSWQRALSSGNPVVFGMPVTQRYVELGRHAYYDGDATPVVGGHAQVALGYDERGIFGPGTWGRGHGNGGWFSLSWRLVLASAVDCWMLSVPRFYH